MVMVNLFLGCMNLNNYVIGYAFKSNYSLDTYFEIYL